MTYTATINKLFNAKMFGGVKLGLHQIESLLGSLNHPQHDFKTIHVAGTNGKGSVSTKIAKAYEAMGATVGLFTSPHICSFRERIQVNGRMIAQEEVTELLSRVFEAQQLLNLSATFFELTTALAFLYFSRCQVDIAVIEAGLGGRLDATNVLTPVMTIITTVDYDHMEVLGNSLEAIALEKAGIIKHRVPIVIGPNVPRKTIEVVAHQKQAPLICVEGDFANYIEENNAIASTALQHLKASSQAILEGINYQPPCRFECVSQSPRILCDVAHNPSGLRAVFNHLKKTYPQSAYSVLLGFSKSKDIDECIHVLLQEPIERLYLVKSESERGLEAKELAARLLAKGFASDRLFTYASVQQGFEAAKANLKDKLLLITGTFFIMGEVRKALGMIEPFDSIDLNERSPLIERNT
ncbi:MAG: bifunctional folylpolyglutamate synthase/dihydrofolate synthase [Parachlamydiaceae bacterium]